MSFFYVLRITDQETDNGLRVETLEELTQAVIDAVPDLEVFGVIDEEKAELARVVEGGGEYQVMMGGKTVRAKKMAIA